MAYSLTTETINTLISSYETQQKSILVEPLTTKQERYEKLNTTYSDVSTKLTALKNSVRTLKYTGNDSAFAAKTCSVSNSEFISASAGNAAGAGSYTFQIDQLAKNDVAMSQSLAAATSSGLSGTHNFQIKTGDGSTGEYVSNVSVTFDGTETNDEMMEAIRDAINSDSVEITSDAKTGSATYSGGAGTFTLDLNGTEKTIPFVGGGTYEDLINEITGYVNDNISGVTAEKVVDDPNPGDVKFKLSVGNSNNYISISTASGYDAVSDLNIGVTNEKGAAGIVTASVFTPVSGSTQFSVTSRKTGIDNRITSIQDTGTSTALSALGLNLGTTRTTFSQSANTSGFVYSDITEDNNLLNAKFEFNGLSLQNNLNDISDLVTNTTFSLKSVMDASDSDVTVSIGADTETVTTSLKTFVTAFNDLYTYLKEQTSVTTDTKGVLRGQASADSLLEMLRNAAINKVSGTNSGNLGYLSQLGLTFDSSNGISISDSDLLEEKLSGSIDQVEDMFNNETYGIATKMYSTITPYLGVAGYLAKSQETFTENVSFIKDQVESVETRIAKGSDNLRKQYQDLQVQLFTLNNTSSQFFSS
jgi:flagellar hook-associated protein 2